MPKPFTTICPRCNEREKHRAGTTRMSWACKPCLQEDNQKRCSAWRARKRKGEKGKSTAPLPPIEIAAPLRSRLAEFYAGMDRVESGGGIRG